MSADEVSYVTGSELLVDGGVSAGFGVNTMPGGGEYTRFLSAGSVR